MNNELVCAALPQIWACEPASYAALLAADTPRTGLASRWKTTRQGSTLIVPVEGILWKGAPAIAKAFFNVTDPGDVSEAVAEAQSDASVSAITLRVNSPSGVVSGIPECAAVIANSRKPVRAEVEKCASAAYWLAASARLVATASSQIGSVGAFLTVTDTSRMLEAAGVRVEIFKSGPLKAAGVPGVALTDEQRAHLAEQVSDLFALFRSHVEAHRPGIDSVVFDGGAYLAGRALSLGLVDEVLDGAEATEATEAQPQARARVVATQHGAGLARHRLEQPDRVAWHEANGRRLVREGFARQCATGGVTSWRSSDFENQKGN